MGNATALLVIALVVASVLAACGAGQQAATSRQTTGSGGVDGQIGDIALRDAQFVWQAPVRGDEVYAVGQDAPLQLTIINTAGGPDRLVAIDSAVASGARIGGTTELVGGAALVSGFRDIAPATTLPQTVQADLALTGLEEPLRAGLTYPVSFTFERAGVVQVQVPIENPDVAPPRAR